MTYNKCTPRINNKKSDKLVEKAKKEAEKYKRDAVLELKEEQHRMKQEFEQELKDKHKIEIDKRKFVDKQPVDHFGYSKLTIELYKGITGVVTILVKEI